MTMKRKRSRLLLINLALTLMLVLVLLPVGTSSKTTQPASATAAASGDCMSQCHMDMSDCLGNGGGYSCIESFSECSAGCNQIMQ
jgi:hypothetical protein